MASSNQVLLMRCEHDWYVLLLGQNISFAVEKTLSSPAFHP